MTESKEERARRLAEALRANLRRRKAQAREKDAGAAGGDDAPPAAGEGVTPPAETP